MAFVVISLVHRLLALLSSGKFEKRKHSAPCLILPSQQRQSPPPRPHVTVENHTTVNLVTHLNTTEPAVPSSSGFSRSPAARHSMYSRLRTGVANSPGLRAPLRLCASQEKLLLDDCATDAEPPPGTAEPAAPQAGGREKRANAVWYEYGCV